MSLPIPANDGTRAGAPGSGPHPWVGRADRRVDDGQPGDGVAVLLGEPEGQTAAHREAGQEDPVALAPAARRTRGRRRRTSPASGSGSSPARSCRARAAGAARPGSRRPPGARPTVASTRRAGEAVAEQHAVRPAAAVVRLGSGHHGRGRRRRRLRRSAGRRRISRDSADAHQRMVVRRTRVRTADGAEEVGRGGSTGCSSTALFVWLCQLAVPALGSRARRTSPRPAPAILVSNHISAGDTFLLPAMIRRRLTFPAKLELFHGRGFKGRLLAWFLTAVGQVPMDRSGGRASAGSMDGCCRCSPDGGLLGIYPEGTRSPDGRLYKGKTGVARLVLQAGVPVIPVAMIDTEFVPTRFLKIPTDAPAQDPDRHAAGLQRVRRTPGTTARCCAGSPTDHGRGDAAVRPGVRRRVRVLGQGGAAARRAGPAVVAVPARCRAAAAARCRRAVRE